MPSLPANLFPKLAAAAAVHSQFLFGTLALIKRPNPHAWRKHVLLSLKASFIGKANSDSPDSLYCNSRTRIYNIVSQSRELL